MKTLSKSLFFLFVLISSGFYPLPTWDLTPISKEKDSYIASLVSEDLIEKTANEIEEMYSSNSSYEKVNATGLFLVSSKILLSNAFVAEISKEEKIIKDTIIYSADNIKNSYIDSEKELYKKISDYGSLALNEETLWQLYLKNKSSILSSFKKYPRGYSFLPEKIFIELKCALPFFDGSLDPEIEKLLAEYYSRYYGFSQSSNEQKKELELIHDRYVANYYCKNGQYAVDMYAWVQRRKHEHGIKYVRTYARIMNDFIEAMEVSDKRK